ncbi:hypothetical protein SAMN05428944_0454 [Streptomyces sp. 1222.5]|uniref:hypothetical protein n=1 Tax=unclassified Streptomyces TaxID=2593676 RepID=UPI00089D6653|nr:MULTISPECIES: hypothetical protein [unclassified Streptomyces]PKW12297.1 hypothetical protein BX260_7642 [Streptomyces sp. 5112.2]SEB58885.1 hypothetical protein SAMN05428944_0454 [Streptomyces sp. 1222.5]
MIPADAGPQDADPAYLAACRDAGLLVDTGTGHCVLGATQDPLNGRHYCLVEYAHPAPVTTEAAEALRRYAAAVHPHTGGVLLRTGPGVRLGTPWTPHLTYLRHDPPADADADASGGDTASGVVVRAAGPEHQGQIRAWLADAFEAGAAQQGAPALRGDAEVQADAVMAAPGRSSLVAVAGGEPAGHATLLPFTDEVTGTDYLELFDTLVAEPFDVRAVTARLVEASLARAARAGVPLLGNVVHGGSAGSTEHGARIVASLQGRGWRTEHVYWLAPNPDRHREEVT